jgi:hypothetical protein
LTPYIIYANKQPPHRICIPRIPALKRAVSKALDRTTALYGKFGIPIVLDVDHVGCGPVNQDADRSAPLRLDLYRRPHLRLVILAGKGALTSTRFSTPQFGPTTLRAISIVLEFQEGQTLEKTRTPHFNGHTENCVVIRRCSIRTFPRC